MLVWGRMNCSTPACWRVCETLLDDVVVVVADDGDVDGEDDVKLVCVVVNEDARESAEHDEGAGELNEEQDETVEVLSTK